MGSCKSTGDSGRQQSHIYSSRRYKLLRQSKLIREFKIATQSAPVATVRSPALLAHVASLVADRKILSHLTSYPLLCLAAQYSQRAYNKPTGNEREAFVNADGRMGTKAMVIKSMPIDDMNCVVFAIRGSQTFMDWAVNLNSAPVSPKDFLVTSHAHISNIQSSQF